jgi:hypothetical protein
VSGNNVPRGVASARDDLVEAFNDAVQFFWSNATETLPQPFDRQRADLTNPSPRTLRQFRSCDFESQRKTCARLLAYGVVGFNSAP